MTKNRKNGLNGPLKKRKFEKYMRNHESILKKNKIKNGQKMYYLTPFFKLFNYLLKFFYNHKTVFFIVFDYIDFILVEYYQW